jgi:hypothetical protein
VHVIRTDRRTLSKSLGTLLVGLWLVTAPWGGGPAADHGPHGVEAGNPTIANSFRIEVQVDPASFVTLDHAKQPRQLILLIAPM